MIYRNLPGTTKTDDIELGPGKIGHQENELQIGVIGATEKGKITLYQEDNQGNRSDSLVVDSSGNVRVAVGTIYNGSDRRMKKYIRPLDPCLSNLLLLNPVTFQWRAPHENTSGTNTCYGLVADEVQSVFADLVLVDSGDSGDSLPSDLMHINQVGMIPILIKAVQELAARVSELEG